MKKFDPRTILLSTFFYIISLILMKDLIVILIVMLFLTIHLYIFKINIKNLKRVLGYSMGLFLSIIFINYFFMGKTLYFIALSLTRVFGLILISVSILTSLEIMEIGYALEKLLTPLKFLGIPTEIISSLFALSLKFIPILKEEGARILLAQKARGLDFSLMTFPEKIKNIFSIFFPIIISGIQHSINIATAMEVRGYGNHEKKSRLYYSNLEKNDYFYLFFSASIILICTKFS